ncbi:jg7529 [Pararge aegeria aegeria]|uniref:Jg7529 protein n=1 Tax=Pararge aegeria aegeria TaxID=348720 RepID=A0A8S4QFR9_9NEOP|nr:jg7529 [Pararge aegeria aegeria]
MSAESLVSSDEELNIVRGNRNRNMIFDSDDDSPERLQPHLPECSLENPVIHPGRAYMYGKNKHKWAATPRSSATRASARNVIHFTRSCK